MKPFKAYGRFTCSCNAGYYGDGKICVNIDECASGDHDCDDNAFCTNDPNGSFTCTCKAGFTGNGRKCSRNYRQPETELFGLSAKGEDGYLKCFTCNAQTVEQCKGIF